MEGKEMNLSHDVTKEEVKKICKELKLRDWTALTKPAVKEKEAQTILKRVNVENMDIALEEFRRGLEVELEHGTQFKDANVTNNHPVLTGKIVLAHLKESLDYYKLLEVAELEGDLLKAIAAKNMDKTRELYKQLTQARIDLNQAILSRLK
jgi:hypothetical protein